MGLAASVAACGPVKVRVEYALFNKLPLNGHLPYVAGGYFEIKTDMRKISPKYRRIGKKLIGLPDFDDIRDFDIKVAFVESDKAKVGNHKVIFADCTKVSENYSWCCRYDFFITVYEPNVENLNAEQIRILLMHELMHIGVDVSGEEPKFYVKPHDVEEFDEIIARYGAHWEVNGGDE